MSTEAELDTLETRLKEGPLRPEVVARLGVHACRALAASPRASRGRRDLSPASIRFERSSDGDLQLSLRAEGERRSPMYLSPEQATHASPPDARSDVYSLCVILYEALSGDLALPVCATESELLTVLVTHTHRPLRAAAPSVAAALAAVVERGLAREPEARWASPVALGEALAPFTGGSERLTPSSIAALPEASRAPAAGSSAARPRSYAWIPVAAGLALVLGAAAWLSARPAAAPPAPLATSAAPASADERGPSKRQVARELLEGKSFFVHLDPRRPGVVVPEHLRKQPQLTLQVGRDLPTPIPDLDLGEAGITATLSFNRKPLRCIVPWTAVFGLVDEEGKGKIWEKDVPPEVAVEMAMKRVRRDAGP